MRRLRRAAASVLLAMSLGTAFAGTAAVHVAAPAAADDYYRTYCSDYPEYQYEEYYYNPPYSYAIVHWDMYQYCYDGYGNQWWTYQYSYTTFEWR